MKSLHDYRGEARAARRRLGRALTRAPRHYEDDVPGGYGWTAQTPDLMKLHLAYRAKKEALQVAEMERRSARRMQAWQFICDEASYFDESTLQTIAGIMGRSDLLTVQPADG